MGSQRYVALDGLRGLAALVVVLWHTGETRFIPGGYLAVDFFFALSGFVLSAAYADRPIAWSSFMVARFVRLYPLYAVGMTLGALMFLAVGLPADGRFWTSLGAATLFLPTPVSWGFYRPYPLDNPAWSLLFELLVNAAWFALLPKLSTRRLALIAALFAPALVAVAVLRGNLEASAGNDFFVSGVIRAGYSFTVGCLVFRLRDRLPQLALPIWAVAAGFIALVTMPGPRPVIDSGMALVASPVLLFLGSRAAPVGRMAAGCAFVGSISYAIYALHAPLLSASEQALHAAGLSWRDTARVSIAVIPIIALLAWGLTEVFDRPARSLLGRLLGRIRWRNFRPAIGSLRGTAQEDA